MPDGSYSVSVIQDHFEYIIKKYETLTENPPVRRIYVKKIENRIVFKIRTGYLELSTTKFLGSNENKITREKDGENVPHLKIAEVVLAHCNIVTNDYQQNS